MAWSANEVYLPGATAGADLSAKQNYFLEMGAALALTIPNSASDLVVGVLCNKPTSGQSALVQVGGFAKVLAGGTVAIGDKVGTDNAGKCVTKTADADHICGIAYSAGVSGDIITILLTLNCQRSS